MPRFYFDMHENGVAERDAEGVELPDVDAARQEAVKAIKDTVLDEVVATELGDLSTAFIEVRDDAGLVALTVSYTEALGARWPVPARIPKRSN